ncbi:polysaccharide biosynthesis C-terminal domain-containing protein [Nocardioides plantarum]|uniref:Polysaccharide biosynthesis C-terminal domain-containing protein n=1 Tax=Nocardioides plantarum TaxID=29299 RepID=A0ABV5KB80_9ACTN|nr:lipopolysaccharide biosynthesis protein [Nocardioides plantarum]
MIPADPAVVQLRHVARGATLGLAGSGFAAVAGFGLAVTITHGLDPADAGRFFALTSGFALLVSASTFGTEAGLARFMLRLESVSDDDAVRRVVLWAVVPTSLVATAWAVLLVTHGDTVAAWIGIEGGRARLLGWIALALPAAVLADVLLASTRGVGSLGPTVIGDRLVRSGLQVAVPAALLAGGGGLVAAVLGWAAAYLVSAPYAAVTAVRSLRGRAGAAPATRRPSLQESALDQGSGIGRQYWRFTWPRGVGSLAQMGIQKADIVVVAVLLTPVDAALYAAATRFVPVGQLAVQALQQVLQPRFTAILVHEDRRTLTTVFGVATSWGILLAWPLYLVVATTPSRYLALFGERYADAAAVVVVMSLAMLVAVATGPVDTLLVMAGRSDLSMLNAVGTLVLDVALCVVLVPRWGITGAAVAWAVAVVTRCGLATWQVRADLGVGPDRQVLLAAALPPLCLVPPAVTASAVLGPAPWSWCVGLGVGLTAYAAALHHWRHELALPLLLPARPPRTPTTAPTTAPTPPTDRPTTPAEERDPTCGLETPYVP